MEDPVWDNLILMGGGESSKFEDVPLNEGGPGAEGSDAPAAESPSTSYATPPVLCRRLSSRRYQRRVYKGVENVKSAYDNACLSEIYEEEEESDV